MADPVDSLREMRKRAREQVGAIRVPLGGLRVERKPGKKEHRD